jgi:hypothetical protein
MFENSKIGIEFHKIFLFDNFRRPDSVKNIIGDIFFGILGWVIAFILDKYLGDVYNGWPKNIKSFNFWKL